MTDGTIPHENLPPKGYVQSGEVVTHGDREMPAGLTPMPVSMERYPALCRALNLVREDNGGASWPAQSTTMVPDYWAPWLDRMEVAVASLSSVVPEGGDYLDTELYTFVAGEHDSVLELADRSPHLTAASNFLCDFFESWTSGVEDYTHDGVFKPEISIN